MNDLVKFSGGTLPANPEDLVKGLTNVAQSMTSSMGGVLLLRLLKDGRFAYGPEDIEPEEGSLWAVNPYTIMHGWACWSEGELLDEIMVPNTQPLPPRGSLKDFGASAPWKQQMALQMQCRSGEDKGTNVLYKSTAIGFANACRELINEIIVQAGRGTHDVVPVVTLEADHYDHKKHGRTYYPVLTIKQWLSIDGESETQEPEPPDTDGEPEPPEAKSNEPAEAPPEQPAEASAPARSRRRRRGQ